MSSNVDYQHKTLGAERHSMLRSSNSVSSKLQLLLDIAVIEGLLFLFAYFKGIDDIVLYYYPAAIAPVLMWFIYSNSSLYRRFSSNTVRSLNVLWAWTKVVCVMVVLAFMTKWSSDFSRQIIVTWFVTGALAQIAVHIAVNHCTSLYLVKNREKIASVLVGNSELGNYLVEHINSNPWIPHKIVGVVSDDHMDEEWQIKGLPKLGCMDELRALVEKYEVRRVYFALPLKTSHQIREMQLDLLDLNVDIIWAPDIFGLHMVSPSVKEVAGVPLYYLSESPMVEGARFSKLILDKALALVAVMLFSPIMIAAAIGVKMSSPGPLFFRQERHGLDGKIIHVLKFRSMRVHDEREGQVTQASKTDSRITAVGQFLRKSSIDELPQLLNVLKGDMSLVGPRPHAKSHNEYYSGKINAYMSRHRILPGMTGLAQVNGFRGETDTLEKMEKRVEYDLAYINNWSIWMDIRIMIKTAYTLFSKNAY